jgi:putative Ca2+/H+ antiporter (TMEM165/GDT1 family)
MLGILGSSFALVALAEMGDKTQLLALTLAARYRRPWTVLAGVLVATVANHALAASVGVGLAAAIPPRVLAVAIALSFFAFGIWTLVPDRPAETRRPPRWGPFVTTTLLFFMVEMGDKTQLATVALGARFHSTVLVTVGTTLGMLAADGLAVFGGAALAARLPMHHLRWAAAALFAVFGLLALVSALRGV